jgi:DNA-binding NarL/FixJ family response regulator
LLEEWFVRLLIVDDHPVVSNGLAAVDEYFDQHADAALIDTVLPDISGFEVIRRILMRKVTARLILFDIEPNLARAICVANIGAMGYVSKNDAPDYLYGILRLVVTGKNALARIIVPDTGLPITHRKTFFSTRQARVFQLLGAGRDLKGSQRSSIFHIARWQRIAQGCAPNLDFKPPRSL